MYLSRHTKQEQAAGAEETEETEARVPTSVVFFSRRICLSIPLYIRRPLVSFVRLFVCSSRVLLCLSSRLVPSRFLFLFFFFSCFSCFVLWVVVSVTISRFPLPHPTSTSISPILFSSRPTHPTQPSPTQPFPILSHRPRAFPPPSLPSTSTSTSAHGLPYHSALAPRPPVLVLDPRLN